MYSNELICDILEYIKKNLTNSVTINNLSKRFHFNKYYIMKKFKKEINMTIISYINSLKVYHSLKNYNNNSSILKIALLSGFNSLEYYSETFSKIMHITPQKYKYFISHNYHKLTNKEIKTIQESIVKLYEIQKKGENYIKRRKPKILPIKKLSLFKQDKITN